MEHRSKTLPHATAFRVMAQSSCLVCRAGPVEHCRNLMAHMKLCFIGVKQGYLKKGVTMEHGDLFDLDLSEIIELIKGIGALEGNLKLSIYANF